MQYNAIRYNIQMEDKEQAFRQELADLDSKLEDPTIYSDPIYPKLAKRKSQIDEIIGLFDRKKQLAENIKSSKEMLSAEDKDLAGLAEA